MWDIVNSIAFRFLVVAIVSFWCSSSAIAAVHNVAASVSDVDCRTFNGGVSSGDTILLAAGERGPLVIRDCVGDDDSPIYVRNDSAGASPTIIRRSSPVSGGFVFACRSCENVVIDGTSGWNNLPTGSYCGAPNGRDGCGIVVTSIAADDAPSSYLMLTGFSTRVTVRGVEINGRRSGLNTRGVAIQQNDHAIKADQFPNFWRENFVYENNYIHNVHGEGMYIGPNWSDSGAPLRNITIRENLVEDTGRQNIQLKMAIGGTNLVHHNVVRRSGLRGEVGQGAGISIYEGGNDTRVYNNWVEGSGIQGIQHYNHHLPEAFGPFRSEIFNNVIYDAGAEYGKHQGGHGISIGSASSSARVITRVFNNSIVKTAMRGIDFNARVSESLARDNVVADTGLAAVSVGANKDENNLTGLSSLVRFVDPNSLNFQLASDSPARDNGGPTGFPLEDFLGVVRPNGAAPDQGAFEFTADQPKPRSPQILEVR